MISEKFTQRSRKVFTLAQQEARRLQSQGIDTRHLLLGLLKEGEGIAAHVVVLQGVDLQKTAAEVAKLSVHETLTTEGNMKVEAKHAIELADVEARDLNHTHIGTEHLLLGLLREEKGAASHILQNLHIEPGATRIFILQTLEQERRRRNPDQII